jgi:polysaccharide pyruvyl transferase
MKVSIITIISQANYGSILQAFSLCRYIETLGYEVELVNYVPEHRTAGLLQFLYHKAWMSLIWRRRKKLREFIASNVGMTSTSYKKFCHLKNNPPVADVYLVGSDQVWNNEIYRDGLQPAFFLDFISGKKKISYASSIGKDVVSSQELAEMKKYLADFGAISVREESAKHLLESTGIVNIVQTLDPVFLLDKAQYDQIAKPTRVDKYLLIYGFAANDSLDTIAKAIAERCGLQVVEIGFAFRRFDSNCFLRDLGVEEFLGLIQRAEYVVTSSFHGTALSLIFQKNFLSVSPSKRRKRLESIMNVAGLRDRLIKDLANFELDIAMQPVNYTRSSVRLEKAIAKSKQYLAHALAAS